MTNFFIFHGVVGFPGENWFPWLKQKLESIGHEVFVPQFPTPENQTLDAWLGVLDGYKQHINSDTILIGHSLGAPFALTVIEKYPVKAAFLVGGFIGVAENEYDDSMKTFAQRNFDWKQIKSNCSTFHMYHSDNDPYISIDKAERVSTKLGIDIQLVKGAGHFNRESGYTEFDLLLQALKKTL